MDIANLVIRVTSDGLTAAQRELGRLRDEVNQNVDANKKMKKGLDDLAKWSAIGLGALGGAVAIATKKAMSFETAMAEVNKTVDFAASDGLANLKKELLDLSKVIPLPFEELAALAASGGQLGIAEKDIASFTETVSKMAIAFDMNAAEAGDAMAKLANVFSIPIPEIGRLGDAINTLSNNSPAKASEIVNAMSRVGGLAKAYGLTADATAGLTSAFVALGKPAEVAASAVNSMLITFSTLDMASKSQLIGFEKLGLNIDEFAQRVKVDGKAAIFEFLEAVNKLPKEDRIGVIAPIIGREYGDDVALLAGSMSVLETQMALVGETAGSTKNYVGSMETEFRKMAATSENALQLTKSMFDAATASIGEAFLPVLNELLLQIAPVIDKVTLWAQANPELVRQIALVTASVLASIVGIKLFADGVTATITTVQNLKTAFDLAKIGVLSLTSPIGIAVTVALGLVAVGFLLYQNWDKVKAVFEENKAVFISLTVSASALTVALIAANAPLIILKVQAAAMAIQMGIMTVATSAWSVAAGIAAAATWTLNAALAVLTSPIVLAVAAIATIAAMGYLVVKNWGAISAGLKAEFNKISSAVSNAVATMSAWWDRLVTNTKGSFDRVKNTIITTLKELPGKLLTIGKQIIDGLVNGIKNGASNVANAIGNVASGMVKKAKDALGIRSPSRVMTKVGEQTSEGMAVGIKKGAKAVKSEAQKMAEGAIKAVQDGVAGLKREIALFGNDSALSALDYDIKVGKFGGANTGELRSLTQQKEQLELSKKLAAANDSVQDSIDGLIKQQALFGNSSALASLAYDIEHTDKYKDVTQELKDELLTQTAAFEQLGMTAKATQAIQARFAQLGKDKEASSTNLQGMLSGIEQESPMEKIQADYEARMAIVEQYEQLHTDMIGVQTEARLAIEQSYQDAKRDLFLTQGEELFGSMAGLSKAFVGEQSGIYRTLFGIQQSFAIASAGINMWDAIGDAMAEGATTAQKFAAAGTMAAEFGTIVGSIASISPKGFKAGGYTGNMGVNQVAGSVHGQEYVFDAQSTKRIGVDNLNAMRSGRAANDSGSNTVNISVSVDAKGNASVSGDNEKMGRDMANGIKAVVMDTLRKEKRQGGMLYA